VPKDPTTRHKVRDPNQPIVTDHAAGEHKPSKIIPRQAFQKRPCGPCTACCTAMGVRELEKKPRVPCTFLNRNRQNLAGGCTRYATRPTTCKHFMCAWATDQATNLLGDGDRPDKVGFMLWTFADKYGDPVVQINEVVPHGMGPEAYGDGRNQPRIKEVIEDIEKAGFHILYVPHDNKLEPVYVEGSGAWKDHANEIDRPVGDVDMHQGVQIEGSNLMYGHPDADEDDI